MYLFVCFFSFVWKEAFGVEDMNSTFKYDNVDLLECMYAFKFQIRWSSSVSSYLFIVNVTLKTKPIFRLLKWCQKHIFWQVGRGTAAWHLKGKDFWHVKTIMRMEPKRSWENSHSAQGVSFLGVRSNQDTSSCRDLTKYSILFSHIIKKHSHTI